MTVKKATRCGGYAAVVARQRLHNTNQQIDIITITKPSTLPIYNIVVGFNEKDQLQLATKDDTAKYSTDDDKTKHNKENTETKTVKTEIISIEDISNCVNVENYPNCENTLVFYITKNFAKEAIALRFENDQDFKRIYFTYKYFKMRNRLANNNTVNYNSTENLFAKKKNYNDLFKSRKNSTEDFSPHDKVWKKSEFDVDNDITHLSLQQKGLSRFDQPMSLIGIRCNIPDSELDSILTDTEQATKPEKRRLFQRSKPKTPMSSKEKINKGEYMKINLDRTPDVIPKESKINKVPDILLFRDTKHKNKNNINTLSNLWTASNKGVTGYESDREDWRSSRSQFSTTAFDSLARPTKMAMALTLKKPQRLEPIPQYYRVSNEPKLALLPFRPNNYVQRPPRVPRPAPELKRNLLNNDHRKFTSLQNLDNVPKKLNEPKRQPEVKKNNSNISHRITGLTNKLRDLGSTNTLGRFKAQSHGDVANLKPVLKHGPDSKRPVVRTCSAEPPKKVTFSAFATVQVV